MAVANGLIVLAGMMFAIYGVAFTGPWPDSAMFDWIAGISMYAFIPTGVLGMILWVVAAMRGRSGNDHRMLRQ
jgi:hypothetical protein